MDHTHIISEALINYWWLIPLLFFLGLIKTPWFKGIFGEALVKLAARMWLPAEKYHAIHNVTLPTPDGTTQIDHIFVSAFGIFVVETKNMKGWIFGDENKPTWTQKIFKQTFKFQNPLRQNYKHVKALESALEIPSGSIHSVIVFTGDSTFKTPMPHNVTHGVGYIRYIKSFHEEVMTEIEIQSAVEKILSGHLKPSRETHRQHIQQLRARSDLSAERTCPKCGSTMVLRTAKRGANAGKQFWGCSDYPKCRVMQNIT